MIVYTIIVLVLTVIYVFIFIGYLAGWMLLPEFSVSSKTGTTKVSIIVAARNEELHISDLLCDLVAQSYPSHLVEILVVDDFSTDDTASIVEAFNYPSVKLLQLKEVIKDEYPGSSYKKKALEMGIAAASGELILTTDADCRMKKDWLNTMVNFYEQKHCHMIVAPVSFTGETTLFERWQSLDFLGMIGITGSTLQFNFPAMCNGANLAFRKKSFAEINGYSGINHVASGDDVLLMHKMTKQWKGGVRFLKSNKAVVYTFAQPDLKSFIRQRIRWASKSGSYTDKRVTINLMLVYLFNISIVITALLCFFNSTYCVLLSLQLVLKMIVEFPFLSTVATFFKRRRLLALFLPAQFLHILYIVVIGTLGNTVRTSWKGRKI
ncbi:MAG: glycosyltransferase [Chitinophagales bacterium]